MIPLRSVVGIPLLLLTAALPAAAKGGLGAPTALADVRQGSLLFRTATAGSYLPAPMLSTDVHLRVDGIIARAQVTQIFDNPTAEWMEAVYVFPLPDTAAVDGLHVAVAGHVIESRVDEKEEARAAYEAAARDGTRAALLEQQRADVFTVAISHIGPGEEVTVVLQMQQVVEVQGGLFSLRFPLVVAPRYSPPAGTERQTPGAAEPEDLLLPPVVPRGGGPLHPVALHVDLQPGIALARLASPTHRIQVERRRGQVYAVDLADGVVPADSDFVLEWQAAGGMEPAVALYGEEVAGAPYRLLLVMPPAAGAAARLPREAVFVIDTSGSMADGQKIAQAKQALLLAIARLQPGDRFNVIHFDYTSRSLFPASAVVDPASLEQARAWIGGLKADGGTVMLPALEAALRDPGGECAAGVRQVVFATDGEVTNEAELLEYVGRNLGRTRLFTLAIGSAPNVNFLRRAARLGRGAFVAIDSERAVGDRMRTFLSRLEDPVLADVEVRFDDAAAEVWPERVPDLYLGEPLVVAARLGGARGRVTVSGRRAGVPWSLELPLSGVAAGAGIDKLWARRKAEALIDSLLAGADPAAVRRGVVELGLAHHLVTPYTSLVAVGTQPTLPGGVAPVTRILPVDAPREEAPASLAAGQTIQETITVATESPLLDERKISTGATIDRAELERLPIARDPADVLASAGVLADPARAARGLDAGDLVGPGAAADQNVVSIDGLAVPGWPGLAMPSLAEIRVATGGTDATLATPGVQIDLVQGHGTNEWRGSGGMLAGGAGSGGAAGSGASGAGRERVRGEGAVDLEGGGALRRDRLWIWGAYDRRDLRREALGGQADRRVDDGGAGKLNAQLSVNSSATLAWNRRLGSESAAGAGPDRAPEATWQHRGAAEAWKLEQTQIASSSFYWTGRLGEVDRHAADRPADRLQAASVDAAGVSRGGGFALAEAGTAREGSVTGSAFATRGTVAHDLSFGGRYREDADRSALGVPEGGLVVLAGEPWGLAAGTAIAQAWRGGAVGETIRRRDLWAQDLITAGALTANAGARLDLQSAGQGPAGIRWESVSPRLGLAYGLGRERRTLLRASVSRFAARLGAGLVERLRAGAPGAAWSFFDDADGDLALDPREAASLRSWVPAGLDPARPGASPYAIDPRLRPETTDELLLGLERSLLPEFVVGLHGTYRRVGGVLERRPLVRDAATGAVFTPTRADWVEAGTLRGALPGGGTYAAPYYDLRPGLSPTGGDLLVNGDRRQDYLGASVDWEKRPAHGWMTRGRLAWQSWTWRLGPRFRRFDDPTDAVGSGDDDGAPVAPAAAGPDPAARFDPLRGGGLYLDARWSLDVAGLVELPHAFSLAAAVSGRQGLPLAYYRLVARPNAGPAAVQVEPFSARRGGDLLTVDARIDRTIEVRDLVLTLSLAAANLLDAGTVLGRETDLGAARAGAADAVLAPRTFRLGVKASFR